MHNTILHSLNEINLNADACRGNNYSKTVWVSRNLFLNLRRTGALSRDLLGPDGAHGLAFMVGPARYVRVVCVTMEPCAVYRI